MSTHFDTLKIGELVSLQEAAEYAGLTKETLHGYAKRGRLRAKKRQALAYAAWLAYHGLEIDLETVLAAWSQG